MREIANFNTLVTNNNLNDVAEPKRQEVAKILEESFVNEMLKLTGVGESPKSFSGGAGEDHFSSFLRDAHAKEIMRAGGLGLAKFFEKSLEG